MLARIKRASFILDVRDLWPDTAIAVGELPEKGLVTSIGRWLETALYRHADLITCVSSRMAERIRSFPKLRANVEVVYNGIDGPVVQASEKDSLEPFHSILYVGNVGRCQALEVVLLAASQLPDTRFRIVGAGTRLDALQGMAEDMELPNVDFSGPCSRDESLAIMARASALLVHLRNDDVFRYTIPSKVFDYLSAGVPILYGLEGEADQILSKTGGNLKFIQEDPDSLVSAVRELLSNYPELAQRARSNPMLLRDYTRKRACERLARILGNIP